MMPSLLRGKTRSSSDARTRRGSTVGGIATPCLAPIILIHMQRVLWMWAASIRTVRRGTPGTAVDHIAGGRFSMRYIVTRLFVRQAAITARPVWRFVGTLAIEQPSHPGVNVLHNLPIETLRARSTCPCWDALALSHAAGGGSASVSGMTGRFPQVSRDQLLCQAKVYFLGLNRGQVRWKCPRTLAEDRTTDGRRAETELDRVRFVRLMQVSACR
jgi:hypothetical protein